MRSAVPQLLLVGLTAALVLTLVVAGGASSASLGAYNTNWDGTSEVRAAAETANTSTTVARNVSAYNRTTANGSVAVVLSPTARYGDDAAAVRSFVRAGGTLLVAEDYGPGGNELLEAVGADARINGTPLRDEQRAGPSPAFPKAQSDRQHPYTAGVETLVLNHGTVVEPGDATTLVAASEFSYLDTNRNRELDPNETLASRPVVTTEPVGEGTVVVVSDPSIFLNAMLERGDNAAFLRAVVDSHDHVVLDVSHTSALPPLVALRLFLQDAPASAFLLATGSILALVVLSDPRRLVTAVRARRDQPAAGGEPTREEVVAAVRQRHPEWDDERIERVTDSLIQRGRKESIDD